MAITIFSQETAEDLYNSKSAFPVDFDDAWHWIGWTQKRTGKEILLNNFDEDVDFLRRGSKSSTGGRPRESIFLTIDCFKSLGMMAGTAKGKEIRRYFLNCEQVAKEASRGASYQYFESLILEKPRQWEEHFSSDWRKNAERLTGWQWSYRCMSRFINRTVYSYFPDAILARLNEVNPVDEFGRRPSKQHQHFDKDVDEKALKAHISVILTLMEVSASLHEFDRLMDAKFTGTIQPWLGLG